MELTRLFATLPQKQAYTCASKSIYEVFGIVVSIMSSKYHYYCLIITFNVLIVTLGCKNKNYPNVIDSSGALPYVTNVLVTPSVLNSDTLYVGDIHSPTDTVRATITILARISMETEDDQILSVQYRFISILDNTQLTSGTLFFRTQINREAEYTGIATLVFQRSLVGQYFVELWAVSKKGYQSITKYIPFAIVRQNRPPIISDLEILDPNFEPVDTVDTYKYNRLIVTVKVIDPDGYNDIYKVYRITKAGNKYELNDNGVNGDLVPRNGVFTETIGWSNPQDPRSDVYKFIAIDRSLDTSNVIIRPIIVKGQ